MCTCADLSRLGRLPTSAQMRDLMYSSLKRQLEHAYQMTVSAHTQVYPMSGSMSSANHKRPGQSHYAQMTGCTCNSTTQDSFQL